MCGSWLRVRDCTVYSLFWCFMTCANVSSAFIRKSCSYKRFHFTECWKTLNNALFRRCHFLPTWKHVLVLFALWLIANVNTDGHLWSIWTTMQWHHALTCQSLIWRIQEELSSRSYLYLYLTPPAFKPMQNSTWISKEDLVSCEDFLLFHFCCEVLFV